MTYRQAALWLTDTEMAELRAEIHAAVTARLGQGPGQNRTRRMISLVTMPAERSPDPTTIQRLSNLCLFRGVHSG